jgi:xylulokinase
MDPQSRGAIAGIGIGTTRAEFIRGVLEGITFELRANLERLATSGVAIDHLRNTGGGSRSRAWVQLKADVLGRPIEFVDVRENAAFGAACLAGQATGLFRSAEDAAVAFVHPTATIEPRAAMVAAYDAAFSRYLALYPALNSVRPPRARGPSAAGP